MELRILSRQNSWKYPGPRRSRGYEATYNGRGNGQGFNNYNSATNQQDCKLFKSRGSCPFGDACRYRHPRHTNTTPNSYQGQIPAKNGLQ